jgi:hypothetical protein
LGGPVIPVGTGNCQVVTPSNTLFELWGGNIFECGYQSINPWQNILDFSRASVWCNDAGYDYKYEKIMPAPGVNITYSGPCVAEETTDPTGGSRWNRDGDNGRYLRDTVNNRDGTSTIDEDVVYWVSKGFGGTVLPDTNCGFSGAGFWVCGGQPGNGVVLPTYGNSDPGQGSVLGQNVAMAFYCDNSVTNLTCPNNNVTNNAGVPARTYFFAKNQLSFQNVCTNDPTYASRLADTSRPNARFAGCRDAGVVLWVDPEHAEDINAGGSRWSINGPGGGGGPDRARIARILNFRIYCDHDTPTDVNTPCNQPPKSIVGNAANSSVWGRFLALSGSGPPSNLPPSLNGVTVNYE